MTEGASGIGISIVMGFTLFYLFHAMILRISARCLVTISFVMKGFRANKGYCMMARLDYVHLKMFVSIMIYVRKMFFQERKNKMAKYRIIERTHPSQGYTRPFCVQKRFLGFLWWYDPLDDGMYSDGEFKTLGEAKQAIAELQQKERRIVIWEE